MTAISDSLDAGLQDDRRGSITRRQTTPSGESKPAEKPNGTPSPKKSNGGTYSPEAGLTTAREPPASARGAMPTNPRVTLSASY